jgi:serine/threonine protein kinase
MLGAMRGVRAAHRERVIHRDVKPENIFLAREPEHDASVAKVLDFGISKVQGTQEIALTTPGAVLGTVLYMAKEQLLGVADIDVRADVYAFGVIAYLAVTGKFPFYGETLTALVLNIMTSEARPILEIRSDVPSKLAGLIERAMAKERTSRLPNLEVFIDAFEEFADERRFGRWFTRRTNKATMSSHVSLTDLELSSNVAQASGVVAAEPSLLPTDTPFSTSGSMEGILKQSRSHVVIGLSAIVIVVATCWWLANSRRDGIALDAEGDNVRTAAAQAPLPGVPEPSPFRGQVSGTGADATSPIWREMTAPTQRSSKAAQEMVKRPSIDTQPATATGRWAVMPRAHGTNATDSRARSLASPSRSANEGPATPPATVGSQGTQAPNCKPNFYFDSQGEKHFKPQCF